MRGSDNQDYPGLPRRLARLRNAAGLSRQELADRAGVTFNTINDIEKGRRKRPMEKTVQSLANVLGVPFDHLATGALSAPEGEQSDAPNGRGGWRRFLGVGLAASTFLALGAVHLHWEVSRDTSTLQCLVRQTGGALGEPRFDDVDADGMVELVRSFDAGRSWSILDIDRPSDDTWKFRPALAVRCEDARHAGSFAYDLDNDGRKELVNLCGGQQSRIEMRDSGSGRVRSSIPISPPSSPTGREKIMAIVPDRGRATDVGLLASCPEEGPGGYVRAIDVHTGRELWQHASEQTIHSLETVPSGDGSGFDVFAWSHAGGRARADAPARLTVIDAEGRICWRRFAGDPGAVLSGTLLRDESGAASLVLVTVNNRGTQPTRPSHFLLLDAHTGARVDSLPYTDMVLNGPLSRRHASGEAWDVYCGTEHGFIRKYDIRNRHIRQVAARRLATHWVWAHEFVQGADGAIVVASADNKCFVVDRDLGVVLHREGLDGAPITPVATFADTAGRPYVAFVCHGDDLCVDRIVAVSGWPTRKWYVLAYTLTGMVILSARAPVRSRIRMVLSAIPARKLT